MYPSPRTIVTAILTAFIGLFSAGVAAAAEGAVRGEVLDDSGGLIPGVTVAVITTQGRVLATTLTNDVGRYEFSVLPSGPARLTFELDGFDTATVGITVERDAEQWVVQRLRLAQITESVIVYGKAQVDPQRPYVLPRRPPPVVIPVATQELDTICQPAKRGTTESLGTIASHRDEPGRTLYAKGDELNIEGGTLTGLAVGQNLVVRRYYRADSSVDESATGEHTAGVVQIVSATQQTSTAVVIHTCSELTQGDFLAPFNPEVTRHSAPASQPAYPEAMRILFADDRQMLGAPRRFLVIDHGSEQGIRVGQRLTLFPREARKGARSFTIGEGVVVSVRTDSATIRVESASDAIWFGDWAALRR